jgi:uracil phosphoribosyltransferase
VLPGHQGRQNPRAQVRVLVWLVGLARLGLTSRRGWCCFATNAMLSAPSCCCRHGPHEEKEVVYERLPSDIGSRFVLLMDPLVGTGRTACRAVQVRGGFLGGGAPWCWLVLAGRL